MSIRFTTTMLLGFFLIFLFHANHVNGLLMQGRGIDPLKIGEEKYKYMDVSETRSKMVGGRKMGLVYYHVEEKENLMKTGANPNVGNYCGNGMKGMLNIGCELSVRRLPSNVKVGSLIPLNSDYHAPKTHPPKNN